MKQVSLRNAQHIRKLNLRLLRRLTRDLLERKLGLSRYALTIHFVSEEEMAAFNESFLQHSGSTDVITFDLREGYDDTFQSCDLIGEIYISVGDAIRQAGEFSTHWTEEIVRYIVHGVLHLRGFDDLTPEKRRKMKRQENRLTAELGRDFQLNQAAR
jgi:rRNA maturation RNase YbeY